MDKLTSIRAFTRVVQHGSFAAAARALRLSRSAVSKYVIELEQELGSQLLVRTTRSASPTENGQAYFERCTAILADLEMDRSTIAASLRTLSSSPVLLAIGTCRLTPAGIISRYCCPSIVCTIARHDAGEATVGMPSCAPRSIS